MSNNSKTSIYVIEPKVAEGTPVPMESVRLVRASNVTQALRHVAEDTLVSKVADQETLVSLSVAGIQVENAVEVVTAGAPPAPVAVVEPVPVPVAVPVPDAQSVAVEA